jgi:hypothetical protein
MKLKPSILLLICMTLQYQIFAQSYTRASVTDFFHFVRTPYLDPDSDYIQNSTDFFSENPEWSAHLIQLADSAIRTELKLNQLNFDMETVSFREIDEYAIGSMLIPSPVEKFNKIDRKPGELYIAIYSTLAFQSSTPVNRTEIVKENLLLRILVEDANGKKVLKNTVKVPFFLQASDYLYQPELLDADFEMIYEEALLTAIKGGKRFKKRPLNYQPLNFYESFTKACHQFKIRESDKRAGGAGLYEIFSNENQHIGVVNIKGGAIKREFTERFLNLDITSQLEQKGTFENSMDKQRYDFTAGLAIPENEEYNVPYDLVLVVFKSQNKKHGLFVLENPNLLTGHWGEMELRSEFIQELSIYEMFIDNEMKGIIQIGKSVKEKRKWQHYHNAFFLNSLSTEHQTALVNLFMSHQITYEVEMEALAESMEE